MFYFSFTRLLLLLGLCATSSSHEQQASSATQLLAKKQFFRIDAQGKSQRRSAEISEVRSFMREDRKAARVQELSQVDATKSVEASSGYSNQLHAEPVNFVINCPGDVNRLARFRKHMEKAGLTFEVFPCVKLTHETLNVAIREGYFGPLASRGDLRETGVLGVALAHMKLLHLIISRNIPAANIFEDDEVVFNNYKTDRRQVLASLPGDAEFVNLNPLRPRGDPVPGADPRLLKMNPGIPRWSSVWLSNYFVSLEGAQKLLGLMKRYDLGPSGDEQIDWHVVGSISSGCSVCRVNAYTFATNTLSMHCENASEKEKLDRKMMSLISRDPIDPICWEGGPEGLVR